MPKINFHNKTFSLMQNSDKGKVTSDTIFEYQQEGNLVTANYHGGTIRYGKIIGNLRGTKLHLLYQCLTIENELKAGKAVADITFNAHGKMVLKLNWEWISGGEGEGTSEYVEV